MQDLAAAFALALVIEGLFYALAPSAAQKMMARMQSMLPEQLRRAGLLVAAAGVVLITLLRR